MTKNALVVEGDTAWRGKVGRDARALLHPLVQCEQPPVLACKLGACFGEGVAQSGNHLEHGQVRIAQPRAQEKTRLPAAAPHNVIEVAEVLRHAVLQKIGTAAPCFLALLLKIEISRYGVMGVVDLDHEVRNGKLQLMHPEPRARSARHETVPGTEELQDIGRLPDDE